MSKVEKKSKLYGIYLVTRKAVSIHVEGTDKTASFAIDESEYKQLSKAIKKLLEISISEGGERGVFKFRGKIIRPQS